MFITIFLYTIYLILGLFEICMIVRAICSWVASFRESRVYAIVYNITEPVIAPVRKLLMRFNWVRNFPLDISFLVVILLLNVFMGLARNLVYTFM